MNENLACPSIDQWNSFILGKCSHADENGMESHLRTCCSCLDTVEKFSGTGRTAGVSHPESAGVRLPAARRIQKLIESVRVEKNSQASHGATRASLETHADHSQVNQKTEESDKPKSDQFAFLRPPEKPGELGRLGDYRILKPIGSGGMGVVFEAEDLSLARKIALKVMRPTLAGSRSAAKRFLKEARMAASLSHDNIVTIYQVGEDNDVMFLAMELLHGESLEACAERMQILPLVEVCRIGREIAEGLAAAHEQGLVHRDIKPSNLWLEGDRARVKILDFGLAHCEEFDAVTSVPGALIGTPAFMSPEQTRGEKVNGRADLFSLGCVLYRLATGQAPFLGDNALAVLAAVAEANPVPPRKLNPQIPAELGDLIIKLLNKSAERRPQCAREVAVELRRLESATDIFGGQSHAQAEPFSLGAGLLQAKLERALTDTLVFFRSEKQGFGDLDNLLKVYAVAFNQLLKTHEEVGTFFHAVCQASLEYRATTPVHEEARNGAVRKELDAMVRECVLAPLIPDQAYTAHITNLPLEHAEAKLRRELEKHVRVVVQHILGMCEKLVEGQILGEVLWANDSACELYFFRRVVAPTGSTSKVVAGPAITKQDSRIRTTITEQTQVTETAHDVILERHEHHLNKAESVQVDRATTAIPLQFHPLLRSIPGWMRPHVRLITGVQFRGGIQTRKLRSVSTEHSVVLAPKVEKVEFRFRTEPAIALGKFVFAGWGDMEMEGENRREEQQLEESAKLQGWQATWPHLLIRMALFVGIELAAALLLCVSLTSSRSFWAGPVFGVLGLLPVCDALRMIARARRVSLDVPTLFCGLGSSIAGAATIHMFVVSFVLRSIGLACLGFMLMGITLVLLRMVQPNRGSE